MQTILGANGQIGIELAKELNRHYTKEIKLVCRHPRKINDSDLLFPADLLETRQTMEAVAGSQIVYLTVGLPMNSRMWQVDWPRIMQNVIDACIAHDARLVYFDNTFMYPQTVGLQTEETAFAPGGPKGEVKAKLASMVLDEVKKGSLQAVICRAPEFYGPGKTQSITNALLLDNIRRGKKPRVPLRDDTLRTLIYTPDASRALALIGNTGDAYQQTWHLPCDDNRLTYKAFIQLAGDVLGRQLTYSVLPAFVLRVAGFFNREAREIAELLPRYQSDNLFVSQKFKHRFPDFRVTSYRTGIEDILKGETDGAHGIKIR